MCLYVRICLVCLETRNKGGMGMGDKEDVLNVWHC